MKDGLTKEIDRPETTDRFEEFLGRYDARLILVSDSDVGREIPLDRERLGLGRGPGVEVAFDDPSMSRQHAVIEFVNEGFRVRDLGSTNGVLLNGKPVQAADIKHGDQLDIGSRRMTLVIDERSVEPDVYELELD